MFSCRSGVNIMVRDKGHILFDYDNGFIDSGFTDAGGTSMDRSLLKA